MLRVYHSNRLDVLEALMEFIVERERLDDPFEPEMILVQSSLVKNKYSEYGFYHSDVIFLGHISHLSNLLF